MVLLTSLTCLASQDLQLTFSQHVKNEWKEPAWYPGSAEVPRDWAGLGIRMPWMYFTLSYGSEALE